MEAVIESVDKLIMDTSDYFDDELTAQLNMTRNWLQETLVTIRRHELHRLRLVDLLNQYAAQEARKQERAAETGGPLNHTTAD